MSSRHRAALWTPGYVGRGLTDHTYQRRWLSLQNSLDSMPYLSTMLSCRLAVPVSLSHPPKEPRQNRTTSRCSLRGEVVHFCIWAGVCLDLDFEGFLSSLYPHIEWESFFPRFHSALSSRLDLELVLHGLSPVGSISSETRDLPSATKQLHLASHKLDGSKQRLEVPRKSLRSRSTIAGIRFKQIDVCNCIDSLIFLSFPFFFPVSRYRYLVFTRRVSL